MKKNAREGKHTTEYGGRMREQRSFVLLHVQNSGDVAFNDAICSSASIAKRDSAQAFFRHQDFLPVSSACCSPL